MLAEHSWVPAPCEGLSAQVTAQNLPISLAGGQQNRHSKLAIGPADSKYAVCKAPVCGGCVALLEPGGVSPACFPLSLPCTQGPRSLKLHFPESPAAGSRLAYGNHRCLAGIWEPGRGRWWQNGFVRCDTWPVTSRGLLVAPMSTLPDFSMPGCCLPCALQALPMVLKPLHA